MWDLGEATTAAEEKVRLAGCQNLSVYKESIACYSYYLNYWATSVSLDGQNTGVLVPNAA